MTKQHILKGKKKQIKTTFFQHRVCTVGPHELPGLEKQLGKLLLNRGNSFPRICLEMVWQVRALLWIHSKPAPLGVQHNLQEQSNQKHLSACHHSLWHVSKCSASSGEAAQQERVKMAWSLIYSSLWWWCLNRCVNRLPLALLLLSDQWYSSGFVRLALPSWDSIKLSCINPTWATIHTGTSLAEEYGPLLCFSTSAFLCFVKGFT